jgi:hypothetical protein
LNGARALVGHDRTVTPDVGKHKKFSAGERRCQAAFVIEIAASLPLQVIQDTLIDEVVPRGAASSAVGLARQRP